MVRVCKEITFTLWRGGVEASAALPLLDDAQRHRLRRGALPKVKLEEALTTNRRIRKTVRPVVWEDAQAQS